VLPKGEEYYRYDDLVEIEEVMVGGPQYHPLAAEVPAYIHRVKSAPRTNRPTLVFYHGCGGIAGSVRSYAYMVNRYAVEADVTIVSVDYRLAPESKAPAAFYDGYAALKWTLQRSFVDP